MKPFCHMSDTYEVALFDGEKPAEFADMFPVFTAAQLNQAKADALREAAAIFDQKHTQLKHCHNYHQCTARDLRAMAAEIEGEKK